MFLDEWNQNQPSLDEVVNTEICWIAPNALYQEKMNRLDYKLENTFKGFQSLQLSVNLRNSKEIAKEVKSLADTRLYKYSEGISVPPSNFPNGPPPLYVKSIKDAVKAIRDADQKSQRGSNKKKGILIITDSIYDVDLGDVSGDILFYDDSFIQQELFENLQNPREFLRQGNSILITKPGYVNGFEWTTVIYKLSTKIDEYIEFHECNIAMRCTTNLFIVNTKETSLVYEHEQILKALPSDETSAIKKHVKQWVVDYLL